jgi:hypothetical protein
MYDCDWQQRMKDIAKRVIRAPSEALRRARIKRCVRLNPSVEPAKSCPCFTRCMIHDDGSQKGE